MAPKGKFRLGPAVRVVVAAALCLATAYGLVDAGWSVWGWFVGIAGLAVVAAQLVLPATGPVSLTPLTDARPGLDRRLTFGWPARRPILTRRSPAVPRWPTRLLASRADHSLLDETENLVTTTPEHAACSPRAARPGQAQPGDLRAEVWQRLRARRPNTSTNDYFPDVAARALSRRGVLGAAGGGCPRPRVRPRGRSRRRRRPATATATPAGPGLLFSAIAPVPATVDAVTVPPGWAWRR